MTEPVTPARPLRIAVAQAAAVPGDLAANVARAVSLGETAEAAVLVFPELFLSGYHPPTWRAFPDAATVTADEHGHVADERLDGLRQLAAAQQTRVLVGAAVARKGRRYIAMLLVEPSGWIRDVYHKQHLCGAHERASFSPGTNGTVLRVGDWRLGLGICYDATFPEHARAAALRGCQVYVTGGAFVRGGEHRRDLYHAARALDNTCYVAFSDAVGGDDPWSFGGGSAIYDPQGRLLRGVEPESRGVAMATLDPRMWRDTRQDHTMLDDVAVSLGESVVVESM